MLLEGGVRHFDKFRSQQFLTRVNLLVGPTQEMGGAAETGRNGSRRPENCRQKRTETGNRAPALSFFKYFRQKNWRKKSPILTRRTAI
jgi:hypothetical protein